MAEEARSAAEIVAQQLAQDEPAYRDLGARLRAAPPPSVVTIARGSSDHAAAYLAYLVMTQVGCPVASLPPSVVTLYRAPLRLPGSLAVAVSQSGQSPDVVTTLSACGAAGAVTAALVNQLGSPLAQAAGSTIPLRAGLERSVAATKSFIASLSAMARVVGSWREDAVLLDALKALPDTLSAASESDVSPLVGALAGEERLLVLGRGPGFSIALEAALKFKETCGVHAEAFTVAEVQHGPMALIDERFPLLIFAPRGPAQAGLASMAEAFRGQGAKVILVGPAGLPGVDLVVPASPHELLDPLCQIQAFYLAAAALAEARGLDPDAPRRLKKVTKTL
ncbi:SIS domain-containing protein [Sorangium sp. So ce1014]|uniref:SIS domain-containing protein n=1 Tax=Sorangium sp. So ce1014 TaxID=3133326 RepID=UPI003F642089